jgi:hypothetical protein
MRQQPAELRPGLEKLRLRAAGRDAQLLGDFFVRISFHVV